MLGKHSTDDTDLPCAFCCWLFIHVCFKVSLFSLVSGHRVWGDVLCASCFPMRLLIFDPKFICDSLCLLCNSHRLGLRKWFLAFLCQVPRGSIGSSLSFTLSCYVCYAYGEDHTVPCFQKALRQWDLALIPSGGGVIPLFLHLRSNVVEVCFVSATPGLMGFPTSSLLLAVLALEASHHAEA